MEFAILEMCLKKRQISNVDYFLKIQMKTFHSHWEKICSSLDSSNGDYHGLFDDWKQVFGLILIIINTTLLGDNPATEREFGLELAKISLQTSSSLLKTLLKEEPSSFVNVERDRFAFINFLINQVNSVMNSIGTVILEYEKTSKISGSKEHKAWGINLWQKIKNQQILLPMNEFLVVLAHYYKTFQMRDKINWNQINDIALQAILFHSRANELDQVKAILVSLNLPADSILDNILDYAFTEQLRSPLSNRLIQKNSKIFDKLLLIEKVNQPYNLRLCFESVKSLEPSQLRDLLAHGVFQDNQELRDQCLTVISPLQVWSYLIHTNNSYRMRKWIEEYFGNDKTSISSEVVLFSSLITSEMIDHLVQNAQEDLREEILCLLSTYGVFHSQEFQDLRAIVRRLLRSTDQRIPIIIDSPKHPLRGPHSMVTLEKFFKDIIIHCSNASAYPILYWLAVKNISENFFLSLQVESKIKRLLAAFRNWSKDTFQDWLTFKAMLDIACYLYDLDQPNVQSLLSKGHEKLAVLITQFAPQGSLSCLETQSDEILFAEKQSLLKALKRHYPMLHQAFLKTKEDHNSPNLGKETNDSPSIYDLLADTIPFDIKRLFYWQQTNIYCRDNRLSLQDLPHFSHPELIDRYGLQIELSYTYYLRRGRPFEAYSNCVKDLPSIPPADKVAMFCRRAIRLAFDNCNTSDIASACIVFLELFRHDTTTVRLHLSAGSLIMAQSAKFLGLEEKSQALELGSILKKAFFSKEQRAVTHLMELLSTSMARKYMTGECSMDELAAYQVVIDFSKLYKLQLPLHFLSRCLENEDWLMFTVFAQYYEYPKDLIVRQLSNFSGCIPEHLEKAFNSAMVTSERVGAQPIIGRRVTESRDTLYTRLGLVKTVAIKKLSPSTIQLAHSVDDDRSSIISEDLETASIASSSLVVDFPSGIEFDAENPPKDLFNLILMCQRNYPTQPSKSLLASSIILSNPIPALIAASLPVFTTEFEPPYSNFDCFCCWLFASFDFPMKNRRLTDESNQIIIWTQQELTVLLQNALLIPSNFFILRNGLHLFSRTDGPLLELVDFFINFLVEKDYHNSGAKLQAFQNSSIDYKRPAGCADILTKKSWIEQTSLTIIFTGLQAADSFYELFILLEYFNTLNVKNLYSGNYAIPDFKRIFRLFQCIKDADISFKISEILDSSSENNRTRSVYQIISDLQAKDRFAEADQVASIMGLDRKQVRLNEWSLKISRNPNLFSLWKDCFEDLERSKSDHKSTIELIERFFPEVSSKLVRVFLLTKQLHCSLQLKQDKPLNIQIERFLWSSIAEMETVKTEDSCKEWIVIWEAVNETYEKNKQQLQAISEPSLNQKLSDEQAFKLTIGKLLNDGKIYLANRVAFLFQFRFSDLELVNLCHMLAERNLDKESAKAYFRSRMEELSNSLLSEIATLIDRLDLSNSSDVVKILEKCESLAEFSTRACKRIVLYYRISFVINISYLELSKEKNEMIILRRLIKKVANSNEAFLLAKELIIFVKISEDRISNLIINENLSQLKEDMEKGEIASQFSNVASNRTDSSFLTLIRLVNDPSCLGRKFLEILKDEINPILAVEICIKAHECFSLCCDIEGISLVLRNSRYLVTQYLLPSKDHNSMIRLLTGIERYSEMSYIFDILKENHQFELLLRKGYQKSSQLRIALLDYLKGDKEMYPLIALNFSMHREIAEILEGSAMRSLRCINLRKSQNTMSYKHDLENIMQEFMDASESFKKAGVFSRSDSCDKMAQLVALQINFLPLEIIVINMNEGTLVEFISRHTKFVEALIVADAYQNHRHWNIAIFQNVVIRGDWTYLREYKTTFPLTTHHIEEVFSTFTKWKANNRSVLPETLSTIKANLHKLIKNSSDIVQIHKYYQELGFLEAANNMMKNVDGAYLRDLKRQGNL